MNERSHINLLKVVTVKTFIAFQENVCGEFKSNKRGVGKLNSRSGVEEILSDTLK